MKTNMRESANPAAEYYAASQLSRVGWKVRITRPLGPAGTRTRRMDLVAERRGLTVRLDVRGLKNMTNWPLPRRLKTSPDRFLILVCFRKRFGDPLIQPEAYVIPSAKVNGLAGGWSGRPGQRAIAYRAISGTAYRDAWHLLRRRASS